VLSTLIVNQNCAPLSCVNEAPLTILELGAGCGLSGLVAARLYQQQIRRETTTVILTDFNARVLENLRRNIDLNDLSQICSVADLDFYQQSGISKNHWQTMDGTLRDPVDIILAADVICQASDAIAIANTIHDVLKPGGTAYVVCADAKHRFGVDRLIGECQRVGLMVSTKSALCSHDVHDTLNSAMKLSVIDRANLEQTTGFVYGMNLTLFTIFKSLCL
jgi:SAM-dependent methyltransferase